MAGLQNGRTQLAYGIHLEVCHLTDLTSGQSTVMGMCISLLLLTPDVSFFLIIIIIFLDKACSEQVITKSDCSL